ncbi:HNH endonuclease [Ruegeria atlantica]|uniref:HNH endonuclease n=1 Tax=Ruegeria atlantica TaxID=81569 RepID=UPI001480B95D|nr:HNH endonuclease signature motif containing protein [Ruegeria atlantica]
MEYRSAPLTASALKPKVLRITITPFVDQLPLDARGGSTKNEPGIPLTLHWRGQQVECDIPVHKGTGRPRGFLRHRGEFTKSFFEESGAAIDDIVIFEVLGPYEYRLHLEKPDGRRISGQNVAAEIEERVRKWALRETRPDQQSFRRAIAARDGLKCAISGCDLPEVLDAAHLAPRSPGGSDDPSNGLILRADLHRLFDNGLLTIQSDGTVTIAERIDDPDYQKLEGIVAKSGADLSNLATRDRR